MADVLYITLPIFALIALGYGTVAFGLFRSADMKVLGAYVLHVAMPALLFRAVATRELSDVLHPGYLVAMALGGLATAGMIYAITAASGTGPARRAIAVMGATTPNSAFVGYPVLLLALPDIAGPVLALNFLVENFVMIPVALVLLEIARPRDGRGLARMVATILWNVVRKPFLIGLMLGLVVSVAGISVPAPVLRFTDILAASAGALALVVIGGTLHGLPIRGNRWLAGQIAAAKLLIHPAMVAAVVVILPVLGLPALAGDMHAAAILSAAMPMIGSFTVLAQSYGHEGIASISLLAATLMAFVTVTGLLALLT